MMIERGARQAGRTGQFAHGHTLATGLHKQAEQGQAMFVRQGGQAFQSIG
ncbi:hypothetical protein GCM10027285_04020 [Oleiagrimonas citrea]